MTRNPDARCGNCVYWAGHGGTGIPWLCLRYPDLDNYRSRYEEVCGEHPDFLVEEAESIDEREKRIRRVAEGVARRSQGELPTR